MSGSGKNSFSKLKAFLEQFKRTQEEKDQKIGPSHTWLLGNQTCTYNIPEERYDELYDLLYHDAFIQGVETHLVERFRDPSVLRVDFDFVFEQQTSKRKYTENDLKDIVKIYNKVITTLMDIPNNKLKAYIFERTRGYHDKGKFKDGFHMMYPDILVSCRMQRIIRLKVLDKVRSIFERLHLKEPDDKVIDESIIDANGWMMYGTNKSARKPYLLTHIYDMHLEDEFNPDDVDNRQLIEYFSIHNTENKDVFEIRDKYKELMATLGLSRDEKKKKGGNKSGQKNRKKKTKFRMNSRTTREDLDVIRKYVSILDPFRADDHKNWIAVGYCLHNIDDELLDAWIEFSKKSPKFTPGECEEIWQELTDDPGEKRPIGIGSLHHFAQLDDPVGYETIKRGSLSKFLELSMNGSTNAIANVVYEMYKYHYVCTSRKHSTWYEFRNHRWHEIEKGIYLEAKLSNEVLNEYLALNQMYLDQGIQVNDEGKEPYIQRVKKLCDVTMKLQDINFKEKVMKECAVKFYDPHFFEKLDTNKDLLGFENGILNLATKEFRSGCPEDYVSLSTGIDYIDYDQEDKGEIVEIMNEIEDYFTQVFPIKNVREYVWRCLASFLQGANPDQKLHIWTGSGSNSKSLLIDLFYMTIGQYAGTLPISLLTQRRGASGNATPELAATRGKRFIYMQEPDRGQKMNIGLMKELTGGDTFMARPLFKDPFMLTPQFKIVLCCNDLPKVPPDDGGTWRRIRLVDFISKFLDNPRFDNEYKIDRGLKDRMAESWREVFIYMLVQKYQDYLHQGLNEPKEVMKATNSYQRKADILVDFLDECVCKDTNGRLSIDELWYKFQSWFSNNYSGQKKTIASKNDFKTHLLRKLSTPDPRGGWNGIRFTNPGDELREWHNDQGRRTIDEEKDNTKENTENKTEINQNSLTNSQSGKISLKNLSQLHKSPVQLSDAQVIDKDTTTPTSHSITHKPVVKTANMGPLKIGLKAKKTISLVSNK